MLDSNIMEEVFRLFREYMGTGLIVIWYLLSVVYLWIREQRKHYRLLFLYVPIVILLLFFNPLFAQIFHRVTGDEVYYRILWLLPMTTGIAFAVVRIIGELQGKRKALFAVSAALILACSGSFIYSNPYFYRAENRYHVPQVVVDICDAIHIEGREVMAAFPTELLQVVRQYDPTICMPYGRETLVNAWGINYPLEQALQEDVLDAAEVAALAVEERVVYLILPAKRPIEGSFPDYDYEYYDTIGDYVLYRNLSLL